jgi:hypothetical protein
MGALYGRQSSLEIIPVAEPLLQLTSRQVRRLEDGRGREHAVVPLRLDGLCSVGIDKFAVRVVEVAAGCMRDYSWPSC